MDANFEFGLEHWLVLASLICGCCLVLWGRESRLERAMKEQLDRSAETLHHPLD